MCGGGGCVGGGGVKGRGGLDDDASSAVVYSFSAKFHHVVYGGKKNI